MEMVARRGEAERLFNEQLERTSLRWVEEGVVGWDNRLVEPQQHRGLHAEEATRARPLPGTGHRGVVVVKRVEDRGVVEANRVRMGPRGSVV